MDMNIPILFTSSWAFAGRPPLPAQGWGGTTPKGGLEPPASMSLGWGSSSKHRMNEHDLLVGSISRPGQRPPPPRRVSRRRHGLPPPLWAYVEGPRVLTSSPFPPH